MKRLLPWLQATLLLLAVAFVYFPVVRGTWLWDDPSEIAGNSLLREPGSLAKIWGGSGTPDYFPLKTSVQWVQWHLWGDRVLGYHLTNLGLQALAAILLWRLLVRLGLRWAYFCALLFAVHPLAVESVAWISELKNVLSLPLLLGAAIAYDEFARTDHRKWYAAALLLFGAAMLAKSSVVMFPAVLLLYSFWRNGRIDLKDLRKTTPFFAVSLALGLVTIHFQHQRVMAYLPMTPESILVRAAGAGWAIWFYLGKCLMPAGLLPIYPRWSMSPAGVWLLPPWIALAGVFGCCWRYRARPWAQAILFGLGSFVLNLLPVLNLVPLAFARISRVSDHLAYLPLVSVVALVGAAASASIKLTPPPPRFASAAGIFGAIVITSAALLSRSYGSQFVNEETLWRYTLRHNPGAWLADNNLGIVLAQSGRPDEAVPYLEAAVGLRPDLFGARMNLGQALARLHRVDEAIPQFAAAHKLDPVNADARESLRASLNNLANALARSGRLSEAAEQFRQALTVDPSNAECHRNYARALHELGRDPEAYEQLRQADALEVARVVPNAPEPDRGRR